MNNSNKTEFLQGFACGAGITNAEAAEVWTSVKEAMTNAGSETIEAGGRASGIAAGRAWVNRNARR